MTSQQIKNRKESVDVETVSLQGESWFKIEDHTRVRPFFMNIVSDSNHWMFISSNGGLTAGRKNSRFSLFPYYTDDKIIESAEHTGSKTILNVHTESGNEVWEPFSERFTGKFDCTRNLYKNFYGNKILFEEVNHDLGLTFRYQWNSSDRFGFVRNSELINHSGSKQRVIVLDGIQNILPYGVDPDLQQASSNLVDAYKKSELVEESGLGIFALSAIITDKAEPSEALKANVVWSSGMDNPTHLLSSLQLDEFRKQNPITGETVIKGERGAYFLCSEMEISDGSSNEWIMVANTNMDHAKVIELDEYIRNTSDPTIDVAKDVKRGTSKLKQLVAGADGLRLSSDTLKDARHFSNVLFNIMRGGTFDHNYRIEKSDFLLYLENASRAVYERNREQLEGLADEFNRDELMKLTDKTDDPDFYRLCTEYLPLKFSRRHGDPSRPWNQFSINTKSDEDGSKVLDYEGNWRDIFQNWEALVHSYPKFIDGMIFRFLNASTFDGYNPYRITKGGFDWETIEPDNPWSYIGYWGDHQIIYLLKFLEFCQMHDSGALLKLAGTDYFAYANVPYRIKPYKEISADPKNTIDLDEESDRAIRKQVEEEGADGSLLRNQHGDIHRVGFFEKILATVLSKMSNFIPEGGIWMNTQRPEWNDANNALVGNGVSMVTLCYLRRFLTFFEPLVEQAGDREFQISDELIQFFEKTLDVLDENKFLLAGAISDSNRKLITDQLGEAGSSYRETIYDHGFSGGKSGLSAEKIGRFITVAVDFLEHTIEANRRSDHLYHSYNLLSMNDDRFEISHLDEMLEGQVAVLSSGFLSPEESLQVLDALRKSELYRADQNSYMLYPNKNLPGFLEKNRISKESVERSELLKKLVDDGNLSLIIKNIKGGYHFNGSFNNARDVQKTLDQLEKRGYSDLVKKERRLVLDIFEERFNHKAFTGRSGTFFAFEGLGSIYWHMVSKHYLAVYEVCRDAYESGAPDEVKSRLFNHFYEVGDGIGIHKSADVYGSFPTDAYSHTPAHRGAQQPGMTGQVKEDILVSIGELGIVIEDGSLRFDPFLLRKAELLDDDGDLDFVRLDHSTEDLSVPEGALCFSCCQVPVIYQTGADEKLEVRYKDGRKEGSENLTLNKEISSSIFDRKGEIESIRITLHKRRLTEHGGTT